MFSFAFATTMARRGAALQLALFTFFLPLSFAQITAEAPATSAACSTVDLEWSDATGTGPFTLAYVFFSSRTWHSLTMLRSIFNATNRAFIESLGSTPAPPFPWDIDLPAGAEVVFEVVDEQGAGAFSPLFTIAPPVNASDCPTSVEGVLPTDPPPPKEATTASTPPSPISPPPPTSSTTSTSSSTSSTSSFSQSSTSRFSSSVLVSTASSSIPNTIIGTALGSTLAVTDDVLQPTLASNSNASTNGNGSDSENSDDSNTSAAKNGSGTMSVGLIAGVCAAGVAFIAAILLLLRSCRRKRRRARETILYPFDGMSASPAVSTREVRGREGSRASLFSSWGNHGDLATAGEEDGGGGAVSPALTSEGHHTLNSVLAASSSGTHQPTHVHAQSLESSEDAYGGYGYQETPVSIQARLNSANSEAVPTPVSPYGPRPHTNMHTRTHGASTSVDYSSGSQAGAGSEPTSPASPGQRFRGYANANASANPSGPLPKSMIDAYRAGLVGATSQSSHVHAYSGYPIPIPSQGQAQTQSQPYATTTDAGPTQDAPATSGVGRAPSYKTLASAFMDQRVPIDDANANAAAMAYPNYSAPIQPHAYAYAPAPPQRPAHRPETPVVNYPPPYTSS
ncbi:hypothetical protein HMN09_00680100 [Mycena chlorophos]|uniref:Uncharacterized protein n=1 Tax=Mycena chlorophos TaxID=658473 RepID=A0A8H6T2M6_MYCCL|nr:hypothetical protein HMN09_00680100 [Mycena chlorophos]